MEEKESDLTEYLKVIYKYKYLIVIILLLFSSVGVVLQRYEVPVYETKAHLVVGKEVVGSLNVVQIQKMDTIVALAKSHYLLSKVADNLDLIEHPIKLGLVDRLKEKKDERYLDSSQVVIHYMNNINIRTKKGGIIEISSASQDPKLAADISNEVGKLLIEENKKEEDRILQKSINSIDQQITSTKNNIELLRKQKDENEASINYKQLTALEDGISEDQASLGLFLGEQEHIRVSIAMGNYLKDVGANESEIDEDGYARDQIRLEYVNRRIDELQKSISDSKTRLRNLDKTEFYKVLDLEFMIGTNEGIYKNLVSQKQKMNLASLIEPQNIRFLSMAYQPIAPSKMRGMMLIFVFAGIGVGFAIGLIYILELINKKFRNTKDIEETLKLKVIGNLPVVSKKEEQKVINPKEHPKSSITESYRTLATNIKFATKGNDIKSITITSDRPRTGKSLTTSNLGIIMAESGNKICMVDVDLRRPTLHNIFNVSRKPGLSDVLAGKVKLNSALVKLRENLYILPAGKLSYNPQSVIESHNMEKLLKELKKKFDFVFCDSIPATSFSDVALLASITDASLLVMDERKSERQTMIFTRERIAEVGSNMLGISVNRTKRKYAKYYYHYYYGEDKVKKEAGSVPKRKDRKKKGKK